MSEEAGRITLEMFQASGHSRQAELAMARMMGRFYGRAGLRYYAETRRGDRAPGDIAAVAGKVDQNFFAALQNAYGLPSLPNPEDTYLRGQKHATQVIEAVLGKALPDFRGRLGLRNEVALYSDSPSNLLRLLAYPDEQIDPKLRFELVRHLFLSHISATIDAQSLNGRVRSEIAAVQQLLNVNLYQGKLGETRTYPLWTVHDNQTNTALALRGGEDLDPKSARSKRFLFETRYVDGIGPVYTYPRKKSDADSILKAVAKAFTSDGVVQPTEHVKDKLGIMFVAMKGGGAIDRLVEKTLDVLATHPRGIDEIMPDPSVDRTRGQAETIEFKRLQVRFKDSDVLLELIYVDPLNYVNSQVEVGRKDPDTGFYNGRAHELYEFRRISRILPILFPKDIYSVDTHRAIVDRMEDVAKRLRRDHITRSPKPVHGSVLIASALLS